MIRHAATLVAGLALSTGALAADLVLVERGAAPHETYRYTPTSGSVQHVRMEMDIDADMSVSGLAIPGLDVPTVFYELNSTVGSVAPDAIAYTFEVTAAGAEGDSGIAAAVRDDLGALVGSKGELVVTARGRGGAVSASADHVGPGPDVRSTLGKLTMTLPEDAVGVGAVWTLDEEVLEGSVAVAQSSRWTLAEIRPDGALVIEVAVTQKAEPQDVVNGKETSKLVAFGSEGRGRTVVHPGQLVPLEASMAVQTDMTAERDMQGTKMPVRTKVTQVTRIKTK